MLATYFTMAIVQTETLQSALKQLSEGRKTEPMAMCELIGSA